jgi:NitT/TauT family transport system substrate-binding protein
MRNALLVMLMVMMFWVAACGTAPQTGTQAADDAYAVSEPETADTEAELEHIDLGVGFIPNIQFAPLYVAQEKGFYAEEGLDVALEYGFENDFVALTAQGERQFAVASGDQVILGQAQGLPIVYVMKWYDQFPVALMALSEMGIDSPDKLAGHSVGLPGLFGATYVGWKALIYAAGLDESQIEVTDIGFTQAAAISENQVDAAMVYITNEPIQLAQAGKKVDVIEVSDYIDLVSNGLITNETVIKENPDLVSRIVRASLKGLQYTLDNPDEAFEISRKFIPEMTDEDAPTQRLVLDASLALGRSDQPGLSSAQAGTDTVNFMVETGLIEQAIEVDKLYTNQFVQQGQ